MRNDAVPWADFDAEAYWYTNYATVFPEDAEIIRFAGSFLREAFETRRMAKTAVDVGAGPNLYPALLMLPWTERIVFTEYATTNIDWLRQNLTDTSGDWAWQDFWNLIADLPGYGGIERPRHRLAVGHDILRLSIFDLPRHTWDLGSMFFVADGISSDGDEFEWAVRSFLGALTPGAPFLMAFVEGSVGYDVAGVEFPSFTLSLTSLKELLADLPVTSVAVLRTDSSIHPVRAGYDAMLLVTGYAASDRELS